MEIDEKLLRLEKLSNIDLKKVKVNKNDLTFIEIHEILEQFEGIEEMVSRSKLTILF